MMRGLVRLAVVAMVPVMILAMSGCSSSDEQSVAASISASPTPSPTPTIPASVLWAGDVCDATGNVKLAIAALGRNLNYDVASDRSALDQIDRQLRLQMLSIMDATDRLSATLIEVPVDFTAANDVVATLTKSGQDTKDAAAEVTARLDAATNADNVVSAGAEILSAVVGARAAFEAGQVFVDQLGKATSDASGQLGEAFAAAPQCANQ